MSDDCPAIHTKALHCQCDLCVSINSLVCINWLARMLERTWDLYFTRPLLFAKERFNLSCAAFKIQLGVGVKVLCKYPKTQAVKVKSEYSKSISIAIHCGTAEHRTMFHARVSCL